MFLLSIWIFKVKISQFILSIFDKPIIIVYIICTVLLNLYLTYNIFYNVNYHFSLDYVTLLVFALLPLNVIVSNSLLIFFLLSLDFNFKPINLNNAIIFVFTSFFFLKV